jgi:hypothetical protein
MRTMLLLFFGLGLAYLIYQSSPIPECIQIAAILDEAGDNTSFAIRWGWAEKIDCVLSSGERRREARASAEYFRADAYWRKMSLSPDKPVARAPSSPDSTGDEPEHHSKVDGDN